MYPDPLLVRVTVLTPPVAAKTAVSDALTVGSDTAVRVYVFAAYSEPSATILTLEMPTLKTLRFLLLYNP